MRYSNFFGKTSKGELAGSEVRGHQLLLRGGFIAESVAGRYFFLPMGWRVHEKIRQIIKSYMDKIGAQEMITPTLHPLELWKETNRTSTAGFELMKVKDRREAEFALGGTAEEMFVDVVRKRSISYRDLPFHLYQFSNKFRDEMRARGGLLRVREFIMKDAYSFDRDDENFKKTYDQMRDTYTAIFSELGLKTKVVLADGGYIGGDYCHEFQVENDIGEGVFFETADETYCAHEDVAEFSRGKMNEDEPLAELETIDQPEWVHTMADNEKHYGQPSWRFLKNVVYKHRLSGEIIIATIRGDLDVNKTKLEKVLNATGQLEDATDEDLKFIGTKPGYVHSWGHKAKYIGDVSMQSVNNFIGGQKTETTDTKNVNYGRDFECEMLADIALCYDGATTEDGKKLQKKTGVEVGNIFQLGTHYTDTMKGAEFMDEDGRTKPYYMGCYGIGLGRTMATIAQIYSDEKGLKWPKNIAPFRVYLAPIGGSDEVYKTAETLYQTFLEKKIDVLYDDRRDKKSTPGQKFSDHELLGIPYRIVLSEKTLAENSAEIVDRESGNMTMVSLDELVAFLSKN